MFLDSSSVHMWMQHCSNSQTKQTLYVFLLCCHLFGVLCKDPVNVSDLVVFTEQLKSYTHIPNTPNAKPPKAMPMAWPLSSSSVYTLASIPIPEKHTVVRIRRWKFRTGRKRSERVCFSRSAAGQCVRHATYRPLYCCSIRAGNNSCSVKLHDSQ